MADAQPWPQKFLMKSFPYAVHDSTTDESVFYGPYMRLLYHFSPLDGPFEIIPQFRVPATPRDSIDSVVTFTVELNKHPVLFILIKLLAPFRLDSKRQEADRQMRERFRDLHSDVVTPALPGIGTLLSFYRYDKATNSLTPPAIAADPNIMTDAAPRSLWDCEILDTAGATRFREMVNEVKGDVCSYRNIPRI
ncbi:uncharacterized protein EV420DRAFT_1590243 [Desarmillaria tabescens]|uniref:Uncharacterized protein n=1 Tax=Armillaria tabescens TaxID=1929756 RepID=A0AA39J6B7_ARMTA|nr:uncharacterized protein EV420DRAFT_1590243 [Desarmillaria tabescens]KAK0436484.1 hypothetical protein EV420DRAFT_1590243 [Desarmillaria tabescens]